MLDFGRVTDILNDLPEKTDEMLMRLEHIETLLTQIAEGIERLASE